MTASQLSILIPTRNRPAILRRTLDELRQGGFGDHPVVVYDDASDHPGAVAEVVASWPGARLIQAAKRAGQAAARNQLMRAAGSQYALFMDDDSWPEDRAALLEAFDTLRRDRLAIVTFRYRRLSDGELSVPDSVGRSPTVQILGGASLFDIPSVMESGGYRDCFIYGYEEPELVMRLWAMGKKIEYLPVTIAHNQHYTPDEQRDYREYDFLYARNSILMSTLNLPLYIGLPHGLARTVRRSLYMKRNYLAKARGTCQGLWMTFSHWRERQPLSLAKSVEYLRFSRRVANL